jgi:hypothetical protein
MLWLSLLVAISGSVLEVALINSWQSAIAINEIQRQVPAQGEAALAQLKKRGRTMRRMR